MSKPRINTDESVAGALFSELGKNNDDEEMEIMRGKYLDSKGTPTPSIRRYINSGEWDSKDKLTIKFMMKDNCWGTILTTGGSSDGSDSFYGKESCSVDFHKKSFVDGVLNRWYIQDVTISTSGYLSRPSMPSFENVGPIPYHFQDRMRDLSL